MGGTLRPALPASALPVIRDSSSASLRSNWSTRSSNNRSRSLAPSDFALTSTPNDILFDLSATIGLLGIDCGGWADAEIAPATVKRTVRLDLLRKLRC